MERISKKTSMIACTGISLLFVVFIILCLVVFALLSFNTAKADSKLRAKRVEATSEYYQAAAKANRTVAKIDRMLESLVLSETESGDGIISEEELRTAFANQVGIQFTAPDDGSHPQLSFSERINDNKSLEVTLLLTDASYGMLINKTTDHYYRIKSWKTVVKTVQISGQ